MTTGIEETNETTAMRGVKWLAEGIAEHLLEGEFTQVLVDAITVNPLWTKFAEAYQLDNELTDYAGSGDGALGRHLDAFIETARKLTVVE